MEPYHRQNDHDTPDQPRQLASRVVVGFGPVVGRGLSVVVLVVSVGFVVAVTGGTVVTVDGGVTPTPGGSDAIWRQK
jgi:hypothetical protein